MNGPARDVYLSLIGILIFCLVALMILKEDPPTDSEERPGALIVDIYWHENVDVDLWVATPNGERIGYSNKTGAVMSLFRDDLGVNPRDLPIRQESAIATAFQPGRYTLNLHGYRIQGVGDVPVSVSLVVWVREEEDKIVAVYRGEYSIHQEEEITMVNLYFSESRELVDVNFAQREVRGGA